MRWLLVLALTGCTAVFNTHEVDPPKPAICGIPAPVPDSIEIDGVAVSAADSITPAPGITVDATPGSTAMTSITGQFTVSVPAKGQPVEVVLTYGASARYPRHVVATQRPLVASPVSIRQGLLSSAMVDSLYGAETRDPTKATLLVSVLDCDGNGVPGAIVTTTPASTVLYQGGGTMTDGTGLAYALDVVGRVNVQGGDADPYSIELAAGDVGIANVTQP